MKGFVHMVWVLVFVVLLYSCTGTRRFGTTIERDENNPCLINMIIQVAVEGTDADVTNIRTELEACFNKECFIPCDNDSTKGCLTKIKVIVKKYSTLNEDERASFHYVQMIDDDGLPSNASLGTPNSGTSSGTWRRKLQPGVFCHEVLHFCGLDDKYCSRLYDPVLDSVSVELTCAPPPDPGANCCLPFSGNTRCSTPCNGHDHNLMATTNAPLSCDNIKDVLQRSGFNSCPQECCNSDKTFTKPPDEVYITPGYMGFGDKSTKFGAIGVSIGYTKSISASTGITLDAGYYTHTKTENSYKDISNLLNITAGVTWVPGTQKNKKGLSVSTHLLAGISNYTQKSKSPGNTTSNSEISFHANIGAALNLKLNNKLGIRLLQADYAPTFFYKTTQHNYRLGAGVYYNLQR